MFPRFHQFSLLMALAYFAGTCGVRAGDPPTRLESSIENEIQKRQQRVSEATAMIHKGDTFVAEKDYERAVEQFHGAYKLLPDSPMTASLQKIALQRFADASVAYGKILANQGRLDEAKQVLDVVLSPDHLPTHTGAVTLRERLQDPDYFNQAMTPKHHENVEKVRTLLRLAQGHVDLGDFKTASAAYNQVLAVDPTNVAARRGLEQCERFTADYLKAARDHTRAKSLREVDSMWETPVPDVSFLPKLPNAAPAEAKTGPTSKLAGIVFPKVSFNSAQLDEVVTYLTEKARDYDNTTTDPENKGLNFVLRVPANKIPSLPPVNVDLQSPVPLGKLLDYITAQTGTKWTLAGGVLSIIDSSGDASTMETRSFAVPPNFLSSAPVAEGGADADPFAETAGKPASGLPVTKVTARQFLEQAGIAFPEGSYASYDRTASRLIVKNTAQNLDLIENFVSQIAENTTKQCLVQVRILQVSQDNLKEMGFEWLLGGASFAGSGRVFTGGGSFGNMQPFTGTQALDWPFFLPSGVAGAPPVPVGQNPVTGGLRGAEGLNTLLTIDDLLAKDRFSEVPSQRTPGVFGIAGVFTNPQFQVVMRALDQMKGNDLVTANTVVMKSGQIAKAFSGREMFYPTDFDPPQIPQTFNPTGITPPITPTTPNAFELREIGASIEVEGTISEDGKSVELTVQPSFTEFMGFINYGSTINTIVNGNPVELVRNFILQPVFDTIRTEKTSLTVYDGATIAFGGLRQSKHSKIEDKVPFLGDIPLVGRLFRSSVEENKRKAVLLFVTVNVIDPAGRRLGTYGQDLTTTIPAPQAEDGTLTE